MKCKPYKIYEQSIMSKKFYPFTVSVVPKNVKIVNVKLFNLMSGVMKQDLQFNTNRVRVNVN